MHMTVLDVPIVAAPLRCVQVEVSYKNIKEVRTAPRAFGLWGDAVIFLKVRTSLVSQGHAFHLKSVQGPLSC
jgi:hypothetical protein